MTITLRMGAGSGVLRVTASGEFSMNEAERTFLDILAAVAQHETGKILVDGRQLEGEPTTIERFLYGDFAASAVARFTKSGLVRAPQFAYVLHKPVLDPGRFGETVAVNRGMWVKVFDDLDDALGWLGVAAASRAAADDAPRRD